MARDFAKPRTVKPRRVRPEERAKYAAELAIERPKTRADCVDIPRPCPWIGCRHHLFLDVKHNGNIRKWVDCDDEDVAEVLCMMPATCALDVAEGRMAIDLDGSFENIGGMNVTLEQMGVTESRVSQIAKGTVDKLTGELATEFDMPDGAVQATLELLERRKRKSKDNDMELWTEPGYPPNWPTCRIDDCTQPCDPMVASTRHGRRGDPGTYCKEHKDTKNGSARYQQKRQLDQERARGEVWTKDAWTGPRMPTKPPKLRTKAAPETPPPKQEPLATPEPGQTSEPETKEAVLDSASTKQEQMAWAELFFGGSRGIGRALTVEEVIVAIHQLPENSISASRLPGWLLHDVRKWWVALGTTDTANDGR